LDEEQHQQAAGEVCSEQSTGVRAATDHSPLEGHGQTQCAYWW